MNSLYAFLATCLLVCSTSLAQRSENPQDILVQLPAPAFNAAEALARCPHEADTLIEKYLQRLIVLSATDTLDAEAAVNQHRSASIHYLARLHQQFEAQIRTIGEQIDRRIRSCSTIANEKGEHVYDLACVESAEHWGKTQRMAAVHDFLAEVRAVWHPYLQTIQNILNNVEHGQWQVVLRVAADAALITSTAAQYAR